MPSIYPTRGRSVLKKPKSIRALQRRDVRVYRVYAYDAGGNDESVEMSSTFFSRFSIHVHSSRLVVKTRNRRCRITRDDPVNRRTDAVALNDRIWRTVVSRALANNRSVRRRPRRRRRRRHTVFWGLFPPETPSHAHTSVNPIHTRARAIGNTRSYRRYIYSYVRIYIYIVMDL